MKRRHPRIAAAVVVTAALALYILALAVIVPALIPDRSLASIVDFILGLPAGSVGVMAWWVLSDRWAIQ